MTATVREKITVENTVQAPVERVWDFWTNPAHIIHWNQASDDWHTPRAENDLQVGGKFVCRMEARNGNAGFDFNGVYEEVKKNDLISYYMEDGRKVRVEFASDGKQTKVKETFEAEDTHPIEMQRNGWQAILDNFKSYVEMSSKFERIHFEKTIQSSPEKVYNTLVDPTHYTEWTAPFNPTSHFKGSWEKGTKMIFLGTDEKGNQGGMVSRIRENIPGKFILIEHLGVIQNDQEITYGPEVEEWTGATERYFLTEKNGSTVILVDMDTNQKFKSFFLESWPKALNALKAICES